MDDRGIYRVVVVQMSVFGVDNGAILEAMVKLKDAARGAVQLDGGKTPETLDAVHVSGVRCVSFNLNSTSTNASWRR